MKILDIPQVGKLGMLVGQGGRYGQVRRTYVIPANPQTPAQLDERRTLASQSNAWASLTQDQQNAWIATAATIQSVRKGGTQGPLTGIQLFVKVNVPLVNTGQAPVLEPPAKPLIGPAIADEFTITNTGSPVLMVDLTTATSAETPFIIRASAPMSGGVNATPQFLDIGYLNSGEVGETDITDLYTGTYGVPPDASKIWIEVVAVQNGYEDIPCQFTAQVPPVVPMPAPTDTEWTISVVGGVESANIVSSTLDVPADGYIYRQSPNSGTPAWASTALQTDPTKFIALPTQVAGNYIVQMAWTIAGVIQAWSPSKTITIS